MGHSTEFDRCRSNGTNIGMEICRRIGLLVSNLSRSLKVIGTDTDRSGTYDFPLTFHSNHGPVLHHFRDIAKHGSKMTIFFLHSPLTPPARRGVPLELGNTEWAQETRMMGATRPNTKFDDIFSCLDTIHERDRQTDGRTPVDS